MTDPYYCTQLNNRRRRTFEPENPRLASNLHRSTQFTRHYGDQEIEADVYTRQLQDFGAAEDE